MFSKQEITSIEHLFLEKYHDGQKEAGELPHTVVMVKLKTVGDHQQEIGAEELVRPEDIRIAIAFTRANGTTLLEGKNGVR